MPTSSPLAAARRPAWRSVPLAEAARRRTNAFDVLRLLAALAVLVSHSFALCGRPEPWICGQTLGRLGVVVFFSISGFLIAASWDRDSSLWHYLAKRALRLLPGLIVVVLLLAFVLGPIVSTVSPGTYFRSAQTYEFVLKSSVLYTFSGGALPGVFAHTPYPVAVDGSLWTLPLEAMAYLGVALLGLAGALRHRRGLLAVATVALIVLASPLIDTAAINGPGPFDAAILPSAVVFWATFAVGAALYAWRDAIRLRADVSVLALVIWLLVGRSRWAPVATVVLLPYVVLCLAYLTSPRVTVLTRPGDVSYGIYIYAFPVQQVIAWAVGDTVTPLVMIALAVVPAYVLALASWRLVESPSLALKRHLSARRSARAPLPVDVRL